MDAPPSFSQLSAAGGVHVAPSDVELAVRVPGFRRVGGLSLGEFVTLQVPLIQSDSSALRVDGTFRDRFMRQSIILPELSLPFQTLSSSLFYHSLPCMFPSAPCSSQSTSVHLCLPPPALPLLPSLYLASSRPRCSLRVAAVRLVWAVERISGVVVGTLRSSDRVLNTLATPLLLRFRQVATTGGTEVRLDPGAVWHVPVTTQASFSLTLRPVDVEGRESLDWASPVGAGEDIVTVRPCGFVGEAQFVFMPMWVCWGAQASQTAASCKLKA
jgi:hypothetical protein